jgi:hypothetical protein
MGGVAKSFAAKVSFVSCTGSPVFEPIVIVGVNVTFAEALPDEVESLLLPPPPLRHI